MTKTYIKPETLVHQVKIENLLQTGSPKPSIDDKEATTNPDTGDYDDAKGFSFFFEEVEDNE